MSLWSTGKLTLVMGSLVIAPYGCWGTDLSEPKVGEITIRRANVFNPAIPKENRPPYTWVNKLHFMTRESVIRRELLMAPGDSFDLFLLANSERNLRSFAFIKDVDITPQKRPDGRIDLLVESQDTWTTDLSAITGISGSRSKYGMLFRERNFLGMGKTIELEYVNDYGRLGRSISYYDARLARTRLSLKLGHSDFNDGYSSEAILNLPVYSPLTPLNMGLTGRHEALIDPVLRDIGQGRFRRESRLYDAYAGHPITATSRYALRSTYGYAYVLDRFTSAGNNAVLPQDRTLSAVKWTIAYVEADYVTESNLNKFERREDINKGWEASLRLAYSARRLGAARNEALPSLDLSRGASFGPGRLAVWGAGFYLAYGGGGYRQRIDSAYGTYYHKEFLHPKNTLVMHAEAARGLRLDSDSQMALGGENGLRGYRFNAFFGSKSALFIIESRLYLWNNLLRILSIAPIAFWDAGYVWPSGAPNKPQDLKQSIGLGWRMGINRSATAPVIRADITYALNREGTSKNRLVFSIGTHHAFGARDNTLRYVNRP